MNQKAKVFVFAAVVLAFAGGYMVSNLVSAPAVSIMTQIDWANAVASGAAVPMASWNTGLEAFYPGMSGQLRVAQLRDRVDVEAATAGNQPGVRMRWGNGEPVGTEVIGGWEYDFGIAEDLANTVINVVAYSPCGNLVNGPGVITAFGVGLRDANGNIMSWQWAIPANQPCDVGNAVSINPGGAGANIVPTASHTDPGFDLTQVTQMLFHESGMPDQKKGRLENGWEQLILSATVPVEESTWGAIKDLYKN
ncbi:MAG: hypothetical protein ACE5EO_12345 [Candidatus Krumholzibacteriia bacterium]